MKKKFLSLLKSIRGAKLSIDKRKELTLKLAAYLLRGALENTSFLEGAIEKQLKTMVKDFNGRVFTTLLTDRLFRSKSTYTTLSQVRHLKEKYGVPSYLPFYKRIPLVLTGYLGPYFSRFLAPLFLFYTKIEMSRVLLEEGKANIQNYINHSKKNYETVNLNHLGEAILGETEASSRLQTYLQDLKSDYVEYISVKISTLYSQISLLDYDKSLEILASRLRLLLRESLKYVFTDGWGNVKKKFVNLDMEEYRDFQLTLDLFMKVLDEEEFLKCRAGIVLQSYLPDSFEALKRLVAWSKKRVERGGVPVKVRLVKGANLANEKVESSIRGWSLAPFKNKTYTDIQFKRMLNFVLTPEVTKHLHVGIASHNLFDIAYGMILINEQGLEAFVSFEMLKGMADGLKRVVNKLLPGVVVYSPTASSQHFHQAIAYLIRRLDENFGQENFLRVFYGLKEGSEAWCNEEKKFLHALDESYKSFDELDKRHRIQNRLMGIRYKEKQERDNFYNESDTDFTQVANRQWALDIVQKYRGKEFPLVCSTIGSRHFSKGERGEGKDISTHKKIYDYALLQAPDLLELERTVSEGMHWLSEISGEKFFEILHRIEDAFIQNRGHLIGCMMADGAKTLEQADMEVSEAIDFIRYYKLERKSWDQWSKELQFSPKGPCLVLSPWNFPLAISVGGIVAALVTGNAVVFKPSLETCLVGLELSKLFWQNGLPPHVLNFIVAEDELVGSKLVKASFIKQVVLTGANQTAEQLIALRSGLSLYAETGGKNAMIVTRLSDRDLAIKHSVESAFGHSGQKCSACSLLICDSEVYHCKQFQAQLWDTTTSLSVGSVWDLGTKVGPLIRPPAPETLKALQKLEKHEEWLVEPKCLDEKGYLWSPGIKKGVKPHSPCHTQEFFAPLLSMMEARHLQEAVSIANSTEYGLTSGLQSLDEREHKYWKEHIQAGNLYINRGITGAIVRRQPFGGMKSSSFGNGFKAGGPNYLNQFVDIHTLAHDTHQFDGFLPDLFLPLKKIARSCLEEKIFWNGKEGC